jgi:hypothetical protein
VAHKHLATYLNDHLAGSVAGLELLAQLEGAQGSGEAARVAAVLRAEIEEDQQALQALMERLQITQSPSRRAVAWLGEKMTQLKLRLDDPGEGDLRLLEMLEALALGIQGKRGMWQALGAAGAPGLTMVDCERLVQRAEAQHRRVEAMRLAAAKSALGST